MKTLTKVVAVLTLMLGLAVSSQAQVALTQTTLASGVSGPAFYGGGTVQIDQVVFLASVTGISAPALPGSPVSIIYVGHEAMGVFTVNTSLKSVGVFRGYLGTQATPHPSGDMVLISNVYATNLAFGANPVPSGFFQVDPPQGASCTAAGTPTTPWVNVLTGAQWLCSSVSKTWVPGFNNPLVPVAQVSTAAVASAATILPTGPLFHLTGTTAVVTITQPIGCNATAVGGCAFTAICDGVCAWTAAGNINVASGVMVAGQSVTFVWDAQNSKWVPSVVT